MTNGMPENCRKSNSKTDKNKNTIHRFVNNTMTNIDFRINGKLKKNKALAGVGKPIKESVCRSSILKLAKRKQAPKVITNPIKGTYTLSVIMANIEYIT